MQFVDEFQIPNGHLSAFGRCIRSLIERERRVSDDENCQVGRFLLLWSG